MTVGVANIFRLTIPLLALSLCAQDQSSTPPPPATDQSASTQPTPQAPSDQTERDVSINPKHFARNFFSDQKMIWTFPFKLATGHQVLPTLAVVAGTAALVAGPDPYEARYFRKHESTYHGFSNVLAEHRTTAATLLTPAAFYVTGLITKDAYTQKTGLLAIEAWVDVDIIGEVTRNIALRRRPLDIPPDGNYRNTWFKTAESPLHATGSFPSGHTAWGFAVATVIARRYPKHKWVPFVAYGLASLDALSRLTSNNHFLSDAVFGSVLGYVTGRYVVLRQ